MFGDNLGVGPQDGSLKRFLNVRHPSVILYFGGGRSRRRRKPRRRRHGDGVSSPSGRGALKTRSTGQPGVACSLSAIIPSDESFESRVGIHGCGDEERPSKVRPGPRPGSVRQDRVSCPSSCHHGSGSPREEAGTSSDPRTRGWVIRFLSPWPSVWGTGDS